MFKNPFTPLFGGRPEFFFGRNDVLARFDIALVDHNAEERALFVTGTRGCGKTTLLEQLSLRARKRHWMVIDLGPERPAHALNRRLAGHDEATKTCDPCIGVNILGSGASISGTSAAKTTRLDDTDLDLTLIAACDRATAGVMVTLDEIQKVPEDEVSALCNAFQMASRKGKDVILVVAGLPFAHTQVVNYAGCTYMRRAVHEELGLLTRDEVAAAFSQGWKQTHGLSVDEHAEQSLIAASYGHPYMVQLLGYYAVIAANEAMPSSQTYHLGDQDVSQIVRMATTAYESRALRPMVSEMSEAERSYLAAMAAQLDERRVVRTSAVATALNKGPKQLSYVRDALMRNGTVISPGRGQLMFNVPYLADYMLREGASGANLTLVREWGV